MDMEVAPSTQRKFIIYNLWRLSMKTTVRLYSQLGNMMTILVIGTVSHDLCVKDVFKHKYTSDLNKKRGIEVFFIFYNDEKMVKLSRNTWPFLAYFCPVLEFRNISLGLKSQDLVYQTGSLVYCNYVMFLQRWHCKLIYNNVK
jgi:hypothetical protein